MRTPWRERLASPWLTIRAQIVLAGNRYYVEDGKTTAGTYVNDQPVAGRVALRSGDRIRVGNSVLCFRERQKRK